MTRLHSVKRRLSTEVGEAGGFEFSLQRVRKLQDERKSKPRVHSFELDRPVMVAKTTPAESF